MTVGEEIETGQAGRHGDRSYIKTNDVTITARHEYLGNIEGSRLHEVVEELVEATEFVWHRDQDEAEVSTTFGEAEVEEVRTNDFKPKSVAARNGEAIAITIHTATNDVQQNIEHLTDELIDYHNGRLQDLMVKR